MDELLRGLFAIYLWIKQSVDRDWLMVCCELESVSQRKMEMQPKNIGEWCSFD